MLKFIEVSLKPKLVYSLRTGMQDGTTAIDCSRSKLSWSARQLQWVQIVESIRRPLHHGSNIWASRCGWIWSTARHGPKARTSTGRWARQ